MLAVIRCKDITTENLSEKIRKYKRLFEEAVKEYQMSQGVLEDSNIPLSKNDKEKYCIKDSKVINMENSLHIFNALIPLRYYTYDLHSEKRLGICDGNKAGC